MLRFLFTVVLLRIPCVTGQHQQQTGWSYANFEVHEFQHLQGPLLDSSCEAVWDIDCGFACVDNAPCVSFNVALSPNENGMLCCELLSDDKFRSPDKLAYSQEFHHYSIQVNGNWKSSCTTLSYYCRERFYQQ